MSDFQNNNEEDDNCGLSKYQREILFLKGEQLRAEGRLDEALLMYLKSVEELDVDQIYPGFPMCLKALAIYFFTKLDYEKSLQFTTILLQYLKSALKESEIIYNKIADISATILAMDHECITNLSVIESCSDNSEVMLSFDLELSNSIVNNTLSQYRYVVSNENTSGMEVDTISSISSIDGNALVTFQRATSISIVHPTVDMTTAQFYALTESVFNINASNFANSFIDFDGISNLSERALTNTPLPSIRESSIETNDDQTNAIVDDFSKYPVIQFKHNRRNIPYLNSFCFTICVLISFLPFILYSYSLVDFPEFW